jgi:hypothetical protein
MPAAAGAGAAESDLRNVSDGVHPYAGSVVQNQGWKAGRFATRRVG